MLALGVIFGLLAATCQSLAYLASRWYTAGRDGSALRQLVLSHGLMGVVCLPLTAILWPEGLSLNTSWAVPAVGVALFYSSAQVALFAALRRVDASRVAPLLNLKMAVQAVLVVTVFGGVITPLQWLAVLLAIAAAFVLNQAGGTLGLGALALLLGSCFGYAGSDASILVMIEAMEGVSRMRASIFGFAAVYGLLSVVSLLLTPLFGSRDPREWRAVVPFAAAWVVAMVLLFGCFAALTAVAGPSGLVFGNILQSTRGVISLVLSVLIVRLGHLHIEQSVSRGIFLRRITAAAMMTGAIALFVTTGKRSAPDEPTNGDQTGTVHAGDDIR